MEKHKNTRSYVIPIVLAVMLMLTGCGGDSNNSSGTSDASGERGSVALYLADAPSDDFDHVWIEVSEISLLPCDDGEPVVIYQSEDSEPIDLLDLQDGNDLLLAVEDGVESGEYCGVRIVIDNVEGESGHVVTDIELPNNTIDINPPDNFDIEADETLSIRLDIDVDKSILTLGDTYSFRPIVFTESHTVTEPQSCPHMLHGQIAELITSEQDDVIGFQLELCFGFDTIDVMLQENTVIFDEDGTDADAAALEAGQSVSVKGTLDTEGKILADLVVVGSVDKAFGIVATAVDDADTFQLDPAIFFARDGLGPLTVQLSDSTMITMGDIEIDKEQIKPNQQMMVVGKYDSETEMLKAIAISIEPPAVSGILTAIEPADEGSLLTIRTSEFGDEGEDVSVILPESAPVKIMGGEGELTVEELTALIACEPPMVDVPLSQEPTEDTPGEALALYLSPELLAPVIVDSIADDVITTEDGETIQVTDDTEIWSHDFFSQTPGDTEKIESGDMLIVLALKTCDPTDYRAVMVINIGSFEMPEMPEVPEMPDAPETPEIPEEPEIPDAPDTE